MLKLKFNYWLAKTQDEFQFSSDGVVPVAKNNNGLILHGFKTRPGMNDC